MADLLKPFRSQAENSPASKGDLKKFFINQKPPTKFDFEVVEESAIEASQSVLTVIEKIDEANKSILKDQSAMSLSGIECDLIRLNRIEQERKR